MRFGSYNTWKTILKSDWIWGLFIRLQTCFNTSTPMADKTTSQTYKFSKPVYPTPELAQNSSISLIPDVGHTDFQDSLILPVKEDTLTNCVKEEIKMNMKRVSFFKYDSPDISIPLNSNFSKLRRVSIHFQIFPILNLFLNQF